MPGFELNGVHMRTKFTYLLLLKIMVSDDKNSVNNVTEAPRQELVVIVDVKRNPVLGPIADVFEGIGCLPGEYKIQLKKNLPTVL